MKPDDNIIRQLYKDVLNAWNKHNAADYAKLFAEDANVIGFDGSMINSRSEIESHLTTIFADHVTAPYIGKVREVRFLSTDVALLRAVVGMIPSGQSDINPATNAIQTLIAIKENGQWRIALFQNTPAQFHGRPDDVQALTDELRELLSS